MYTFTRHTGRLPPSTLRHRVHVVRVGDRRRLLEHVNVEGGAVDVGAVDTNVHLQQDNHHKI